MASVDVYLHGRRVGVLAHRSALGDATEFRLTESYRDDPERPVLGQVFEDDPGRLWRTTHRIPAWFSNLLPEGRLRALLAEQSGVNPERELHLLAALGEDLAGAVVVRPHDAAGLDSSPVRGSRSEVDSDETLRFSLAGLQLKFPVELNERGLTVPVRGQGGRWIAKLPDPRFADVPRNEATMLSWARASGIEVPEHRLVETREIAGLPRGIAEAHPGPALIVRRFDRLEDGASVHIEDFAQIRGVVGEHDKYHAANYESIGRVLMALCGAACVQQYVRRLVFMLLSGNADMHLKNWSVVYADRRAAALAPAYDLVATRVFRGTSRKLALKLARTRTFEEIDRKSFERLGVKLSLDPALVVSWVEAARDTIRERHHAFAQQLPAEQRVALDEHLASLRL